MDAGGHVEARGRMERGKPREACGRMLERIGGLLDEAAGAASIPGAVAAVGRGPEVLGRWVAGWADTSAGAERPMTAGTVFDLASLTKLVGTTTLVLGLAGVGALALDDPVTDYLPGFAACREGPVTIRHLLTHTSGLPATVDFYRFCHSRQEVSVALCRTPLETPPGTRVTYSDLGFMALGEVARVVTGESLDAAVRRLVTGPLGLDSTGFVPLGKAGAAPLGPAPRGTAPARPGEDVAATERREDGCPWTGVVHDENARASGGVAGHAGLFAPLADVVRFAQWWVSDAGAPVPEALRREAESDQTPGLAGRRGLGWSRIGDRWDILGRDWPPAAVSHTGFTGTSLALDPASGVWVVLLTNAVHFGRDSTRIKALRADVHKAVAEALLP
jgi:CubicO group peptidase (beta-lactamase class C family)